ncbi:MAG: hypothetical protein KI785_06805 [Devosiaceae bacterium]|nr:hypothetical protein [Devosiaceae bacterium MH13]
MSAPRTNPILSMAARRGASAFLSAALFAAPLAAQAANKGNAQTADAETAGFEGVVLDLLEDDAATSVSLDGVTVTVASRPDGDGITIPIFIIEADGQEQLRFEGAETFFSFLPVTAQIAHLDTTTPQPEVITTSYTGGAHCCDVITIASVQADGTWKAGELGSYDGGYRLTDFNRDGIGEVTVRDQSFLYTFDAYAGSWAPPLVHQFVGGAMTDVSADPAFSAAFTEEIGDFIPERNVDRPGALAGWAAMEARLGRGDEALERLRLMNATVDWPYQICPDGGSRFDCEEKDLQTLTFRDFVRHHLVQQGYLETEQ